MVNAVRLKGRVRRAWVCIGLGVLGWAVGEVVWQYYAYVLQVDPPYPGIADFFWLAGYPLMFAGVLLLPHIAVRRWERLRLSLDATAGTVALAGVAWALFLADRVVFDGELPPVAAIVDLAYPLGDLVLLIGLMLLAIRRSVYRFDGRLIVLGVGMLFTAVADVLFALQMEAGTYWDGSPLDGLWLFSYGLFGLAGMMLAMPAHPHEHADRPPGIWPLVAPYTAVAVLVLLTLREVGGEIGFLGWATAAVAVLVIARQVVAIRETGVVVNRRRDDLVASISHELRTPLTAMNGFVEVLLTQPDLDPSERSELLEIVGEQTRHLVRIVGDLVEVARDNLMRAPLHKENGLAADLVAAALRVGEGEAREVTFSVSVAPDLVVYGDQDRLRQVLTSFVTNAVCYGGGRIHVVAGSSGGAVMIEVHDDGPGVPKKYELSVWDRFERGAHRLLSGVPGSGLGLAIARQLIDGHGGETGYRRSEILGGACFWFAVPTR